MAKTNLNDILVTDTFQDWLDGTNGLIDLMGSDVMTASVSGDTTSGDATLIGSFSANTVIASDVLKTNLIDSTSELNDITIQTSVTINDSIPLLTFDNGTVSWDVGFDNTTNDFVIKTGIGDTEFVLANNGDLSVAGTMDVANRLTSSNITLDGNNPEILFEDNNSANSGRIAVLDNQMNFELDNISGVAGSLVKFRIDNENKLVINADGSTNVNGDLTVDGSGVFGGTTKYNTMTINGSHLGDGDNNYGLTINSFEPAITLLDRSTGAGSSQIFGTGNGGVWLRGDTTNDGTIGHDTNTTDFLLAKFEPINTIFYTNGAERVRIDSSGNVGIGTNSPSQKLTVDGGIAGTFIATQSEAENGTVTNKVMTPQRTAQAIEAYESVKGYIAFNGTTGSVIKSKNLTLVKNGTGSYRLTADASIRDGSTDWGVVITNIDDGTLSQDPISVNSTTISDFQNIWWNVFLNQRFIDGFSINAKRTVSEYYTFLVGNDNAGGNAFRINAVDPEYIALVVF